MKSLQPSWNSDEYLNREISNAISFKGQLVVGDLDGYIHIIDPLNGSTTGREKFLENLLKRLLAGVITFM